MIIYEFHNRREAKQAWMETHKKGLKPELHIKPTGKGHPPRTLYFVMWPAPGEEIEGERR